MKYQIGMYLRLSDDDGDIDNFKVESNSIAHQRAFIRHYISTKADLINSDIKEYIEDGHTGVNFKRPSVTQLLEDVKKGVINCIIVKDLSRFGRNVVEVGDYLEKIFPLLNVRFIAINDVYDSHKQDNTFQALNIDVAFRNLMNEAYSRDISQKVKAVKQMQKEQGKVIGGFAPFGYVIKNHQYEIDEETAPIVRTIFRLAADGVKFNEIARRLNSDEYAISKKQHWTAKTVSKILHNKVYIGTLISNKSETIAPRVQKNNAAEKWIVIENHHPAIIEKEVFESAAKGFHKPTPRKMVKTFYDELKGKVKCGCCGRTLKRHYLPKYTGNKDTEIYLTCDYGTSKTCYKGQISIRTLKKAVVEVLNAQIKLVVSDFEKLRNNISDDMRINEQAEIKLQSDLDLCKKQKALLYTDYKSGILTAEQYLQKRESLNAKVTALNNQLTEVTEHKCSSTVNALTDIIETLKNDTVTQEQLIEDYVKEVRVFTNEKIEVKFSFDDMICCLEKN